MLFFSKFVIKITVKLIFTIKKVIGIPIKFLARIGKIVIITPIIKISTKSDLFFKKSLTKLRKVTKSLRNKEGF